MLRLEESHCEEHDLSLDDFWFSFLHHQRAAAFWIGLPVNLLHPDSCQLSVFSDEFQRVDIPSPGASFLMAGGGLQRAGIVWPWVLRVHRTFHGLWHDLNLRHALASLAVGCADAVASGVATANHEHMLAFGRDALIFAELHSS